MKYLLMSFLFFTCFSSLTFAQQNHFIYLQTDNKQPFYIKLDNKILSSSSTGYLIVGKLTGDNYKLVIGFPKNEWPEQNITVNTNNKDAGFLLKNFGEKGWGLFNIQSSELLMSGNVAVREINTNQVKDNDLFSTMLANVVNDSTILEKDIVKDESQPVKKIKLKEIKEDEPKDVKTIELKDAKKDEPKEIKEIETKEKEVVTSTGNENKADAAAKEISLSVIKRTLRKKSKEGTELVYIDEYNNSRDTIRIFIPAEKEMSKDKIENKEVVVTQDKPEDKKETVLKNDTVTEQKNGLVPGDENVKDKIVTEVKEDKPAVKEYKFIEDKDKPVIKSAMINSDCKATAGEDDFLKLRKKMAAENSDENMIKVAKKGFKSKCYSTELIKNLSTLFLKDEGKYMFFDAAYPYVSDSDLFAGLNNQLTDTYYINRFNAMVHK